MSTAYSIGQMNQLGDALESAGFTPDEVTKLRNFPRLKDIKRVVNGQNEITTVKRLAKVGKADVPDAEEMAITEQLLREKYNFGWFGDNFKRLFFGKTLNGAPAEALAIHQLTERVTNQQIRDDLGEQAMTPFAHALSLVEEQRNGEQGVLLVNSRANLIVVEADEEVEENGKKVVKKTFWAVNFAWYSGSRHWGVGSDPIGDSFRWGDGRQVLSRDC